MSPVASVRDARNISDLRKLAERRLPSFSFGYLDGGAEDEVTLRANRSAFEAISIVPRQLVGLPAAPETRVDLLGKSAGFPLAIAPTGYNGLLARNGDLVLASLARANDFPFVQSTMSSSAIEDVASTLSGARHWFQLYMLKDEAINRRLVQRALDSGCEALVLTTDAIALGNREGDKHNYRSPGQLNWNAKLNVLTKPAWLRDVVFPSGPPGFGNLQEFLPKGRSGAIDGARFISAQMDSTISWDSVEWLRRLWPRKLIIKGIMHPDDAVAALDRGADAVIVSNHGGRQLDGAPAAIVAVRPILDAVAGRCDILLDSGVRRGSDIFKATALGVKAVLCGRAVLYGLAAGGEAGAGRAIEILRTELERTMALVGCASLQHARNTALKFNPHIEDGPGTAPAR